MDVYGIIHVSALFLGSIISFLLAYPEIKKRNMKSVKFILFSLLFFILLILTVIDAIHEVNSPKEDKKEVEKVVTDSRDTIGAKIDETSAKTDISLKGIKRGVDTAVEKLNNLTKPSDNTIKEYADIQFCVLNNSTNPKLIPTNKKDSFLFMVAFCNLGNINVSDMRVNLIPLTITNKKVFLGSLPPNSSNIFNKYFNLPAQLGIPITIPVNLIEIAGSKCFMFVKLTCRDKHNPHSLIQAFLAKPVMGANDSVIANEEEMNLIEKFLKKNNMW